MNTRLLRRIAKVIQEKPAQFDMNYWHKNKGVESKMIANGEWKMMDSLCSLPKGKRIACGTTHCIAGWAQAISTNRNCEASAESDATSLLDLNHSQAQRLFYADHWPTRFQGRKKEWDMSAKKAAARIEHFIKTRGAE